jgi:hypothetical protein
VFSALVSGFGGFFAIVREIALAAAFTATLVATAGSLTFLIIVLVALLTSVYVLFMSSALVRHYASPWV